MGGVEAPARGWAPGTSTPDHQHSGPRANGYLRLAYHRPIQSVYWHCPKAFVHLPPQAGLCSACFAKLYVAAIKPPVEELTYLVELLGGLRRRRRAKARTPPQAAIRPGSRALTIGLGERYVMTAGMRFQYQTIAV